MKYVCLGFIDEKKFASIPQADVQRMMEECFAYDDELRRGGHFLGGEALDHARNAVTLRVKDGEVEVTDGPYVETKETLGGILLLEARDLNHAIALMSKHPGVKMGPFEIRPANEAINRLIAERSAAITKNAGTNGSAGYGEVDEESRLRMISCHSFESRALRFHWMASERGRIKVLTTHSESAVDRCTAGPLKLQDRSTQT